MSAGPCLKSLTKSLPVSFTFHLKVSPPSPPCITSLPKPPVMMSLPVPPIKTSLPEPPSIVSTPVPPYMMSLPALPSMTPIPVRPVRRSSPAPPVKVPVLLTSRDADVVSVDTGMVTIFSATLALPILVYRSIGRETPSITVDV